jgi:hypothetical protein
VKKNVNKRKRANSEVWCRDVGKECTTLTTSVSVANRESNGFVVYLRSSGFLLCIVEEDEAS